MSWHREWKVIEESISELTGICSEFVSALQVNNSDSLGTVKNVILPMAQDIGERIRVFGQRYKPLLSEPVLEQIEEIPDQVDFLSGGSGSSIKTATAISHFVSLIRKFRSDFNYLTSDLEGAVVRLTARAFTHLQRSIIADADFQKKWIAAKKKNERACEKLGAVHLLLHGIWSFKIDAAGERTDLVLGEPLREDNLDAVYHTAEGLVLTEWKLATESNCEKKCNEALSQAELYTRGSLAAIELKQYRYLIIVSDDFLGNMPSDFKRDDVIYKYINIAVNPSTPSVQASKKVNQKIKDRL